MQAIPRDVSNKLANMSFLCAIFVVLIHVWAPEPKGSFAWWLYVMTSFRKMAVPFFFLMSGYLLAGHIGEEDWWKRENLKRIKTLLIPYVLWSVLWMAFLLIQQVCNGIADLSGLRSIVSSHRFLGFDLFNHPQMEPLWYVRSLLIFVFCSPILVKLLMKNAKLVLWVAFACLFFSRCRRDTYYYLIDSTLSLSFVFYFVFGMALRAQLIKVKNLPKRSIVYAIGFLAAVLWGVIYAMIFSCAGEQPSAMFRFAIAKLFILDNMLWMYFIWSIMPTRELPKLLANTAFPIYLVHWFVLVGVWQGIMHRNSHTVSGLIMSCVVGIVGTLLVVIIMKRCFPKCSSVLFGGRC